MHAHAVLISLPGLITGDAPRTSSLPTVLQIVSDAVPPCANDMRASNNHGADRSSDAVRMAGCIPRRSHPTFVLCPHAVIVHPRGAPAGVGRGVFSPGTLSAWIHA